MSDERMPDDQERAGLGSRADEELAGDDADFEGHRSGPPGRASGSRAEDEAAGDEPDFEGHRV